MCEWLWGWGRLWGWGLGWGWGAWWWWGDAGAGDMHGDMHGDGDEHGADRADTVTTNERRRVVVVPRANCLCNFGISELISEM